MWDTESTISRGSTEEEEEEEEAGAVGLAALAICLVQVQVPNSTDRCVRVSLETASSFPA